MFWSQVRIRGVIKIDLLSTYALAVTNKIKALTALVGRLSLSIDWESGPELGRKFFFISSLISCQT